MAIQVITNYEAERIQELKWNYPCIVIDNTADHIIILALCEDNDYSFQGIVLEDNDYDRRLNLCAFTKGSFSKKNFKLYNEKIILQNK